MRLLFIYLAVCLILFSCKSSKADENLAQIETNDPPQIENTVPQKYKSAFAEIADNINGLYPSRGSDSWREDKYGNYYVLRSQQKIDCSIAHSPDLEVIMSLQNYIYNVTIYTGKGYSSTITDISFLEHLSQLRILSINGDEGIETFEPLKYLLSLEELDIGESYYENCYHGTFDCSILSNLKNLRSLTLYVDELANKETIFSLPNLKEIWLSDYFINTNDPSYYKNDYGDFYEQEKGGPAYQHKLGKYNILQYRANMRTEPSRDSDVLASLHLNDEVEILENSWIAEKINDVWGFWYKIKYGDMSGYTFGGNIAIKVLETDIDKNGIKDYFYLRYSSRGRFCPETDIIIYINNQKIDTSALGNHKWMWASFYEEDDHVLVVLSEEGRDSGSWERYKVTSDDKIEHLDWRD